MGISQVLQRLDAWRNPSAGHLPFQSGSFVPDFGLSNPAGTVRYQPFNPSVPSTPSTIMDQAFHNNPSKADLSDRDGNHKALLSGFLPPRHGLPTNDIEFGWVC